MTALETVPGTGRERLRHWQPWLSTLVRLVLAAVWLAAGFSKITDLAASVRGVRAYDLLPEALVQIVGNGLPLLEIMFGLLLLVGFGVRLMAVVTTVFMLVYMAGIASVWSRGLRIDCGCFSHGGQLGPEAKPTYGLDLLRDSGFLILALLLAKWSATRFAIESLLYRGQKEEA
jgi:uncharacterized membrane protein YphA (DoxX/SURF4 family)